MGIDPEAPTSKCTGSMHSVLRYVGTDYYISQSMELMHVPFPGFQYPNHKSSITTAPHLSQA
jgi:hypothetical protein